MPPIDSDPELKRSISLFQATMYGIGLILGAGIYVLIGDVAAISGNAIWISFLLAAAIASLTGLSYAELSSVFPKSAAEYVYVKESFGSNFAALFVGCLIVFVAIASAATVAIGFSGYLAIILPQYPPVLYAVGLVLVLSILNFYGINESMQVNIVLTLLEIGGLLVIITIGLSVGSMAQTNYFEMPNASYSSSFSLASTVLSSTVLAFFAYYGFENISNISEETKNPTRTIPKALMFSILVTTVLYVFVAVSSIALTSWEELSKSDAPLALVASKVLGGYGKLVLTALALIATTNTVLMMLISGSRIIFGIAKNDEAIPTILAEVHCHRKTPWLAIVFTTSFTLVVITLYSGKFSDIAAISVFSMLIVFSLVNFAVIVLRFRRPDMDRRFISPFKIRKFPILPALGLIMIAIIIFQFKPQIIFSTIFPLVSISILCLILMKRARD